MRTQECVRLLSPESSGSNPKTSWKFLHPSISDSSPATRYASSPHMSLSAFHAITMQTATLLQFTAHTIPTQEAATLWTEERSNQPSTGLMQTTALTARSDFTTDSSPPNSPTLQTATISTSSILILLKSSRVQSLRSSLKIHSLKTDSSS